MIETYTDHVLVRRKLQSAEFLAIRLSIAEGEEPVCIYRYEVPGRTDIYSFNWMPISGYTVNRVGYFSDQCLTLAAAAAMIARDLNKKAVVEMLVKACQQPEMYQPARVLVECLLPVLAPKSAAMRDCTECLHKIHEARRKSREKREKP